MPKTRSFKNFTTFASTGHALPATNYIIQPYPRHHEDPALFSPLHLRAFCHTGTKSPRPFARRPARQKAFFEAFPKTFFELEVLFGYHPELIPSNLYASGYDYTEAFRNKIPAVPVETRIDRLITLFMDGHWEADAPSYLKEELHTYADAHPLAFFRLLARHTPAEQRLFWQCFWQNPCKDPWLATALSHYKKAAARKYPRETAVMMSAYRDFAGTLEGR